MRTADNWIAAAKLGLLSSTFSTLVSHLAAYRIGRDPWVDWMSVAAIPFGDGMITAEPTWLAVIGGIAFHQWADFSCALVFFGLFGRWTGRLGPRATLPIAAAWAVITSASEWLVLVPLFPFWQPIFTLQQPYWIGFLVHLSSAVVYPFFFLLRDGRRQFARSTFLKVWSGVLAGIAAVLLAAFGFGLAGRELRWLGNDPARDQLYIRRMVSHHEQGRRIAAVGEARAQEPRLQAVARLMVATQTGEMRLLRGWWDSWFGEPFEFCSSQEAAEMPGMVADAEIAALKTVPLPDFEQKFVSIMSKHHRGGVAMADDELHSRGDLRLRIMAHAIRHEQQGEIGLMQGLRGVAAVRAAIANMFANHLAPAAPRPR